MEFRMQSDLLTIERLKAKCRGTLPQQDIDGHFTMFARQCQAAGDRALLVESLQLYREISRVPWDSFLGNKIKAMVEFLEGREIVTAKPSRMIVALTSKCILNCLMCGRLATGLVMDELPEMIVAELTGLLPYMECIQWLGGEVFLSKYFETLFSTALACPNVIQGINTNGLLVTEPFLDLIAQRDSKVELVVSIDGLQKQNYEYIRRGASFDVLLTKLALLKRYVGMIPPSRFKLKLNFVLMRSNYRDLPALPDFARSYGFSEVQVVDLNNFDPLTEFEKENISNDPVAMDHVRRSLSKIEASSDAAGIVFQKDIFSRYLSFPAPVSPPAEEAVSNDRSSEASSHVRVGCRAPWDRFSVDFLGQVQANRFCPTYIGNIKNNSIEQIWNAPAMQHYRKKISAGENNRVCQERCFDESLTADYCGVDLSCFAKAHFRDPLSVIRTPW